MWTAVGGLFLVNLKSGLLRNVDIDTDIYGVVPYVTYYFPGTITLSALVFKLSIFNLE